MSEVSAVSLKCYNLIKNSILSYDDILARKNLSDYIFPQSAFRLIENCGLSLRKQK